MSCASEAEGSSALKYVVPGVVGAVSLVLARRWGAGGATGGGLAAHVPPTGVSRRRRLAACRDPPLKRPQHQRPSPAAAVQHPQPQVPPRRIDLRKPATSSMPATDDDSTAGNRRNARATPRAGSINSEFAKCNFPSAVGSQSFTGYDVPSSPKHFPFPNIPRDDELTFELMMFTFTSLAAGAQFLNLYRTVWWLPHSYTSQTMNFYLIDFHVVLFILVILSRRLIYAFCSAIVQLIVPTKTLPVMLYILNFLVMGAITVALGWCIYNLFPKHPILNMFYLCYPFVLYVLLFRMQIGPFLQVEGPGIRTPHCCANGAPAIRNEVELLKADFNYRLKQIIFSSLIGAYYASFVPWCFSQHFLHYDVYRIIRHLALVWLGLFTQHATHCLSAKYCDQLHRAALHLGRWVKKSSISAVPVTQSNQISGASNSGFPGSISAPVVDWCNKTLWAPGSFVNHNHQTFMALGCMTAAEPDNMMHSRFYSLFNNPSNVMCVLLCMQISLVLLLLVLLLYTTEWHFIISLSLLLSSNYYTLFKLVRDYLVTWKLYSTEYKFHEKNSVPVT